MASYVMFGKYSPAEMAGMSKERTTEAVALVQKCGGQIKAVYALLGRQIC